MDIPEDITPGKYRGQVTVRPENSEPQTVDIVIKIKNEVITDRGDNEPWRHSRLRWLNSTLGIDDMPTKGYDPIEVKDNDLYILTGKEVSLDENILPQSVKVNGTELLAGPVSFNVETKTGEETFSPPADLEVMKDEPGIKSGEWTRNSNSLNL